jgi:hypothetical protein
MNKKQSRKQPQQARSRVTVTAILDAMIRILDREGVHAATPAAARRPLRRRTQRRI